MISPERSARTRIKVCGMREPDNVREVVAAGVDAVGFIFVKQSPRFVEPEQARRIIKGLPPFVDAVGVFLDEQKSVVNELVRYCGLTLAQLHGDESPEYCREIACRTLKALRIGPHSTGADLAPYAGVVSGLLLDTFQEKLAGGTGRVFDWQLIADLDPPGPIILAGGLTPENVGDAVRRVRPFGIDLNSGVERTPGLKDIDKVRRAVAEVAAADAA